MKSVFTAKEITDQKVWEDFITKHPEANFLHSWLWGEFHKRIGHTVIRRGYYKNQKLIGVLLAVVEPAKQRRHLTVPAGPIMDWKVAGDDPFWINDLKDLAKQHKCIFVRVRPQLENTPEVKSLFKKLGFRRAPMHLHAELTSQLDLTKSDEELKKAMRKGTRYELNRASKLGIKVEEVSDKKSLDKFYDIQIETAKRHNFVPFSKKFLLEQFQVFKEADKVLMYKSTHEGKLLAMAFVIFYGQEAAYHYGASTDLARKIPGAYATQWQAIQEARKRGCTRYNFWGVTEHGQTNHRFYGVSVFKRGFGGQDLAYLPTQDLVVDKVKYLPALAFETARRKLRKL